jgi:hypothetical protein
MTGARPTAPLWRFGQTGVIHERQKGAGIVVMWGIFLGYEMGNPKSLRVYVPSRKTVYHLVKFDSSAAYPDEWNFKRRKFGYYPLILFHQLEKLYYELQRWEKIY